MVWFLHFVAHAMFRLDDVLELHGASVFLSTLVSSPFEWSRVQAVSRRVSLFMLNVQFSSLCLCRFRLSAAVFNVDTEMRKADESVDVEKLIWSIRTRCEGWVEILRSVYKRIRQRYCVVFISRVRARGLIKSVLDIVTDHVETDVKALALCVLFLLEIPQRLHGECIPIISNALERSSHRENLEIDALRLFKQFARKVTQCGEAKKLVDYARNALEHYPTERDIQQSAGDVINCLLHYTTLAVKERDKLVQYLHRGNIIKLLVSVQRSHILQKCPDFQLWDSIRTLLECSIDVDLSDVVLCMSLCMTKCHLDFWICNDVALLRLLAVVLSHRKGVALISEKFMQDVMHMFRSNANGSWSLSATFLCCCEIWVILASYENWRAWICRQHVGYEIALAITRCVYHLVERSADPGQLLHDEEVQLPNAGELEQQYLVEYTDIIVTGIIPAMEVLPAIFMLDIVLGLRLIGEITRAIKCMGFNVSLQVSLCRMIESVISLGCAQEFPAKEILLNYLCAYVVEVMRDYSEEEQVQQEAMGALMALMISVDRYRGQSLSWVGHFVVSAMERFPDNQDVKVNGSWITKTFALAL